MSINEDNPLPDSGKAGKIIRGLLQTGGAVPVVGGILSAIAGAWSERDQDKINEIIEEYLMRLQNDFNEQKKTLIEVLGRLDAQDQAMKERFESHEYQDLIKKAFRNWAQIDSEKKREFIRNLLINAASTSVTSDDVISLFMEWIHQYSTLHFEVISAIYNSNGITRGAIWNKIGKSKVREDSSDADLYKLLFRDLSTGGIIRQHRPTDSRGNYLKQPSTGKSSGTSSNTMTSAFDNVDGYELTALGKEFVHYVMTDLPPKIGSGETTTKEAAEA